MEGEILGLWLRFERRKIEVESVNGCLRRKVCV